MPPRTVRPLAGLTPRSFSFLCEAFEALFFVVFFMSISLLPVSAVTRRLPSFDRNVPEGLLFYLGNRGTVAEDRPLCGTPVGVAPGDEVPEWDDPRRWLCLAAASSSSYDRRGESKRHSTPEKRSQALVGRDFAAGLSLSMRAASFRVAHSEASSAGHQRTGMPNGGSWSEDPSRRHQTPSAACIPESVAGVVGGGVMGRRSTGDRYYVVLWSKPTFP
jgi:hypothetical protein